MQTVVDKHNAIKNEFDNLKKREKNINKKNIYFVFKNTVEQEMFCEIKDINIKDFSSFKELFLVDNTFAVVALFLVDAKNGDFCGKYLEFSSDDNKENIFFDFIKRIQAAIKNK